MTEHFIVRTSVGGIACMSGSWRSAGLPASADLASAGAASAPGVGGDPGAGAGLGIGAQAAKASSIEPTAAIFGDILILKRRFGPRWNSVSG
jgi:hypothetical protein